LRLNYSEKTGVVPEKVPAVAGTEGKGPSLYFDRPRRLVMQNDSRWPYRTSDHPVIKVAHAKHPRRRMTGLRAPGIQILYPLAPRFSLSLLERTFWKGLVGWHGHVVQMPILKEHVDFDNSAQVRHAARFIFCRDGDFDLARDMCRETPELRSPDQPELASQRGDQLVVRPDETK